LRSFDFLCRCLGEFGEDNSGLAVARLHSEVSAAPQSLWQQVLDATGEHFVLPLLWRKLAEKGVLGSAKPPVGDMLEELHRLNGMRNARLRTQLVEIGSLLAGIGVTGVFLKGANFLYRRTGRPIG
jgi:Uncharacterised nucleotidyltransferase